MKSTIAMLAFAFGTHAFAQSKPVCVPPACHPAKDAASFRALNATSMKPGSLYFHFTQEPGTFEEWVKSSPVEYEFLGLWDGYKEPLMLTPKDKKEVLEKLTMFVSSAKAIINKPITDIKLQKLIQLDFVRNLDTDIKHEPIAPTAIMPLVAGKGEINNFKWCNAGSIKTNFKRPMLETNLAVLNRPGSSWCSDTGRSLCLESCYHFPMAYTPVVWGYNKGKAKSEYDKKDFGFAIQSEVRYFTSEAELGKRRKISELTGIDTPVRGILEQNIFYINQLLQYGKVLAVFQEHPTDAGKTIVTSYYVFGAQTETWLKKYDFVGVELETKEVLMGRVDGVNTETGLTAGFPVYTRNFSSSLATKLENMK